MGPERRAKIGIRTAYIPCSLNQSVVFIIPCLLDRRVLFYFSLLSTRKTAQTSGNYSGHGLFELVT